MVATSPAPADRRLAKAVERANQAFADKNLRFTKLRQDVFQEIAATYTSIGAYDILARLAEKGTRLAPISVYRAIDALLEAGVIHRLESKNAYFACRRLDHQTGRRPIFLSCEKCNAVQEVDSEGIFDTIDRVSRGANFQPRVKFVEVSGLCRACAPKKD
jgi:Fur family zinc uptake transcriptional regulator